MGESVTHVSGMDRLGVVRPAGFEPATLGLEGRCREIPECQLDAYGIFFAVRINPSLSNRPRLGSLWSLMPPTPAVGEQPGAPTRRVGRMPARCAGGEYRISDPELAIRPPLDLHRHRSPSRSTSRQKPKALVASHWRRNQRGNENAKSSPPTAVGSFCKCPTN